MDHERINEKLSGATGLSTRVVAFDDRHVKILAGRVHVVIEWDKRDNSIYSYMEAIAEPEFAGMKLQTWVLLRLLDYMDDDEELIPNKYPAGIYKEIENISIVMKKMFIEEPIRIKDAYYFCLGYATGKMDCLDGRIGG